MIPIYTFSFYSLLKASKLGCKVCTRFSCSPRMEGSKRKLTGPISPFKSYSEMNRNGPQLHDSDGVSHGVPLGIHARSNKIQNMKRFIIVIITVIIVLLLLAIHKNRFIINKVLRGQAKDASHGQALSPPMRR